MKLTKLEGLRAGGWLGVLSIAVGLIGLALAHAQAFNTTTVQGTVYLANGQPGTGTLVLSWPSFTTAAGQLVVAGSTTVTIAPDGFISVSLAPNQGATPAGEYYTAVYYLSDGSSNTQYWVVPAAAQATLGQVQASLMPAAQAVQAVSKSYVDQALAALAGGTLTISGTTLTGPLTLCCDPTQPLQAADKHYVDENVALDLPLTGGTATGPLTGTKLGALNQVDQFAGADFGAKLGACLSGLSATNGGICDARNFSGTLAMGSNLTISTANATVLLPCATIATANQVIVTAGTRNVSLRGCSLRGASTSSGSQGGTVFLYSGTGAMVQVGDPTYAADTNGFHLDNAVINTTASASATAQGFIAYRAQELYLESLYFLGNSNQTGMTLDGTGNYTGGTFLDDEISGYQTAVNAIGHQIANSATTDWLNASSFVRLHIDCPTSGGSPIAGSYGINLQQGDGNTFTGGDVEGCATALHLGANAQNNTIVGLRNENSTNQAVADAGSSYNNWMNGGTLFTGQLTDNGTRNSFLDTFHRSFNGLNGDWYGSQKDATVTNHYRLGTGAGNERGLLNEIQTDYGYRWLEGYTDATAGEQFYQIQDLLNNVNRLSVGQYNNGQSSSNNQTSINAAGTGAVVLNGSNNSGTGGVVFGSGGASESTVASINNAGNAQFNGTLQVGGTAQSAGTMTVRNNADAEVDYYLWPGLTTSQKGSFTYKDWNGNSQWYMLKDASNNWALNSATGGLDSFKAYQSTNSGDTYVNASNTSGTVRINYETGSGAGFKVYGGNSSSLYASFTGSTAIQFPGLAATSGHNCLQVDNSGYVTNTGVSCGTGGSNGTINAGTSGQIAYYSGSGTALSGTSTVAITAGGIGASTASGALTNLGAASLTGSAFTGPVSVSSTLSVGNDTSIGPRYDVTNSEFGAKGDGATDDTAAIQAAFNACYNNGAVPHGGIVEFPGLHSYVVSSTINAYDGCRIEGTVGGIGGGYTPPTIVWSGPIAGSVSSITGFTVAVNSTPVYAPSSPAPYRDPYIATFTAANSLSAGQWVDIEGLTTTAGASLNRGIFQVVSATGSSFVAAVPFDVVALGTFTDTGTATTANVIVAFDANAHYEQEVKDISLSFAAANTYQVGFYFGSRIDTGSRIYNTWVSGATEYSYYFTGGGINVDFDKGWRSDGAGLGGIYWRVSGNDSFGIANGTVDNDRSAYGSISSGGAVVLDNSSCGSSDQIHFSSRDIKVEANTTLAPGLGVFTLYDCPSLGGLVQFYLDFENTWVAPSYPTQAGFNFPSIAMSPSNDGALIMGVLNSQFPAGSGSNTTQKYTGIPALSRNDLSGGSGYIPELSYAPAINSNGAYSSIIAAPTQFMDDVNVGQLWQYGIHASDFLYTDTAFAALPNATTLFAGQIVAPPAYWSGANGKRYALEAIYQTGTTGSPNGGATTCTGSSGTSVLTCTSATDLSTGQRITIGSDSNKTISYVNATNPGAVLVNLTSNLGSTYSTATALGFSAPVLGPEIQMHTKSSGAPTSLAWSQGDLEENAGAASNGVAAWVNVAAGTPGTWAGIPLGNSSGQIAPTQISSTTGSGSAVLASSPTISSPTISGNATTFANGAASQDYLVLQPGTGGTDQIGALEFANNAGTSEWEIRKDASNSFRIRDTVNSLDRLVQYAGGQTVINSGGAASVAINNTSNAGSGGFIVYEGGSNYNTAAFTVTSSGNASVPGGLTSSAVTDTGLSAAGLVTTTSGGTLGSEAMVTVAQGGTGATTATAALTSLGAVSTTTTVNGHALSGNVTVSASDLTTGTLPHAQLPALVSGDIPSNAANTTGNAATATNLQTQVTGLVNGNGSSAPGAASAHNVSAPTECIAASGSGTAYTCASSPTFTPAAGDRIQFKADVANAGAATLNVNSTSAAPIYKWGNTAALIAGDLQAGHWISAYYDGNHWQLEGQLGNSNATQINGVSLSGLSTGIVKNTTATGVPTIAVAGTDYVAPGGNITGTAANLSGTPALPNGTTATTQSANDNSTKLATTAYVQNQARNVNTPDWLQYLGTGADGAETCNGTLNGDKNYTTFSVPYGDTCTVNAQTGLTIHATGACTIAGLLTASGTASGVVSTGMGSGSGGGSGGGAAAGTIGGSVYWSTAQTGTTLYSGGSAGASSGGNGGNGSSISAASTRVPLATGLGLDGFFLSGSSGSQGGSSGGARGYGGLGVTLICASITGTDGTHTGVVDASGGYGMPPSANSTGAGSGGAGGVAILSSQAAVTTWPAVYFAGGPGGLVTVPEAAATSGSCTTQPKATLGVTSGALSSCAVVQAGAGCGTGSNVTFNILGGGGSGGTITPTWSGGALASCTASGGSGYTAATYTTAGTGGDGGNGWSAEFAGW